MNRTEKTSDGTLQIESLSHDGRGVATVNGKKMFITGALPFETVTYHILKKRSHYYEAETTQVLNESPKRVNPPCDHFGVCGGCKLQHMDMALQLALKQQTLLDQLKHFGKVEPQTVLPPLSAESLGYRQKARLGVKYVEKKNKVLVGFRENASRYLAMLNHCPILNKKVGEHLQEISDLIASLKAYRHIPQIEVAIGDEDVALVFRHLEKLSEEDHEKLKNFGKINNFHIYLQPNKPEKISKIWPHDNCERLTYTLPTYDLQFLFHPLDFTQINLAMNRLMVEQAITLLDVKSDDSILDLFCGIGNFTLPLARKAKYVVGIEGSEEMVERAHANAQHNKISHVNFYAHNLDEPQLESPYFKLTYNKILLDPPRIGAKNILQHIAHFDAERIVYVSCNPATLARDAGELVHQQGYTLETVGIMNMFPHTAHIEAIALFKK